MPNDSFTQQALAADRRFLIRVRANLATVAWEVIEENPSTPDHAARAAYAKNVLANLDGVALQVAQWLVQRPNLMSFATSYDFTIGAVVTTSGDPDIKSQLADDWNDLAGV